jgi:hypothetical protein
LETALGGLKIVFMVASLQPNGIPLTFTMVGIRDINDIGHDFGWNEIVVLAIYHVVVDGEAMLNETLQR